MPEEHNDTKQKKLVDTWARALETFMPTHLAAKRAKYRDEWWKAEQQKEGADSLPDEVTKAVNHFRATESLLEKLGEGVDAIPAETSVTLPLGVVLDVLPERYVIKEAAAAAPRDYMVRIALDDLFEQLAQGKVTIDVASLVFGVPADLVTSDALRDDVTRVSLPLAMVVASINPDLLAQRTAKAAPLIDIEDLPDPFDGLAESPVEVVDASGPDLPAPPEAPEPVSAGPVAEVPRAVPAPEVARSPEPAPPVHEALPPPPVAPPLEPLRPAVVAEASPPKPPPPVPGVAEVRPAVAPVPAAPTAEPRADEIHVNAEALGRLGGVNLNTATFEQLLTLDGVTPLIARGILEFRAENGPLMDIFDLGRISRVGRKTFRKITGMPYSRMGRHRREKLAKLLDLAPESVAHLPSVVRALAARPGFAGCAISDREGLLLAQSRIDGSADALSAIVPRMLKQVRENMAEVADGEVQSLSVCVETRMFTVVASGRVFLTALHEANRLTMGQFKLIKRVAGELAWLLCHRGYVAS